MTEQDLTLEQKIGQLFVTGFPQEYPSEEFIRLVREYYVGNVILFSHNIKSKRQLTRLTGELFREIADVTGVTPLISIDEEGGVVSRLPEDTAIMPSALAQAGTGDDKAVCLAAEIVGKELKSMGVNFNLAPVLDINSNRDNPLIGVRSFGETAKQVIRFGRMAVKGYLDAGILCSGKHFPGHGDTDKDSHLELPTVSADRAQLADRELAPFAALIEQGIPAITVGHILAPALEPESVPCTLSRRVVTNLLREQMGFDGLIISDCMEMAAIKEYYGIPRGTVEALKAGIDLIYISHTASAVEEAVLAVREAVRNGELSEERIDQAVARILTTKKKFGACSFEEDAAGTPEQIRFAKEFLTKSIHPLQDTKEDRFFLGESPLFIGIESGRVTLASDGEDPENFAWFMQQYFGGEAVSCSTDTSEEEIEGCLNRAVDKTSLVVGTLNAHLMPGQCGLLKALGRTGIPMAHVALRNPYDLEQSPEAIFKLPLYEYTTRAMESGRGYFYK